MHVCVSSFRKHVNIYIQGRISESRGSFCSYADFYRAWYLPSFITPPSENKWWRQTRSWGLLNGAVGVTRTAWQWTILFLHANDFFFFIKQNKTALFNAVFTRSIVNFAYLNSWRVSRAFKSLYCWTLNPWI